MAYQCLRAQITVQLLFSSGSLWSYSVARCFRFAAEAGFDGLEIVVDQRWDTRQAEHLRSQTEATGLPVVAVHSPFWPHVPGWPQDPPGRIVESVKLAQAIGARVVVHHLPLRIGQILILGAGRLTQLPIPFWRPQSDYRRWLNEEYAELQASTDVLICIENMPAYRRLGRRWNLHYWNEPEQIARFPNLTLDTTHLGTWGLDPLSVYHRLQDRVAHVHLSNFDGQEHRRPEDGDLPLDRLLRRLAIDGYDGAVSLELYPQVIGAGQGDEEIISCLAESLQQCRNWIST